MTQKDRAKQFQPFDAMKGLREALLDREERHLRVEKKQTDESAAEELNRVLSRLTPGMKVAVRCYLAFHEAEKTGRLTGIDTSSRSLALDGKKIFFDDIYSLEILDF